MLFILRRLQKGYNAKGKELYICMHIYIYIFVYLERAFDRIPRNVLEWAISKKGIP